jgi:ABC-type glycerol-3-phosphate transport system permease component
MIDGATRIEMLLRTVISLSIPGILSCKIFSVLLPTEWALLTGHEHATR